MSIELENPLVSVNYHVIKACDARCTFCFAHFHGVQRGVSADEARAIIDLLADRGTQKLNFAGGEPTLHRHLGALIRHAKSRGMVTSIVTNGSRLPALLDEAADVLDWVALSVDSASEGTQHALGRGKGDHVARALGHAALCRERGVRLKLNTVVTALNHREDMSHFVRVLRPERWKVFQVLRVEGENHGEVEPLLISEGEFSAFVERHAGLAVHGLAPVAEDNDAMIDSYVMIDPAGRFFGNTGGVHSASKPILEVGVEAALAEVGYDPTKLVGRGGIWKWSAAA